MLEVRPAQLADAAKLAPRLREADLQEIQAVLGEDPLTVLERSIRWSEPCYAVVDGHGQLVALFGVVPNSGPDNVGIIWLVGSNELVRHPLAFLRRCRQWVAALHQRYKVLGNYVDARNGVHIRWLRWCEFTIHRLVDRYGVEQRPFYEFSRVCEGDLV
jgi:hypothetical protein